MSDYGVCYAPTFTERAYKPYTPNKIRYIQTLYIIAGIIWASIILIMGLYRTDVIGLIILTIPFIIFIIGYYNASVMTPEIEEIVFKSNYLSVGLLVVIPLFTWLGKHHDEDRGHFIGIITLGVILSMISLLDFWVKRGWMSVIKHLKSVLQTMALTLFILAFYVFYTSSHHKMFT